MKLIVLILGLAIGFGGGVYVGVHHPEKAAEFSKQEEEWFLKGKAEATKAIADKLDRALSKPDAASPTPGSGFVASSSGGPADPKQALREIRDEQKQQLQSIQTQLTSVEKRK